MLHKLKISIHAHGEGEQYMAPVTLDFLLSCSDNILSWCLFSAGSIGILINPSLYGSEAKIKSLAICLLNDQANHLISYTSISSLREGNLVKRKLTHLKPLELLLVSAAGNCCRGLLAERGFSGGQAIAESFIFCCLSF